MTPTIKPRKRSCLDDECCHGSAECALNQDRAMAKKIFMTYDKNKEKGRAMLLNLFCSMGDTLAYYKFRASKSTREG